VETFVKLGLCLHSMHGTLALLSILQNEHCQMVQVVNKINEISQTQPLLCDKNETSP
jgi:hypothetical protein